ncbi:MAG: zinc transporter ZntB [Alphaproteobacteria bacterium]|nr:zinc transporter ZntB [Alphaproteobacteria bacterium]MBU0798523.1 zinc transporter ZntB [Alphaproteobacteria bacterium]MBU0886197.1 zinc transporter ZntB [Alphaproteobacteria bacterium]MBU1812837.1 zinc transporter ZntB [Alphaproteobacteria bacterium]
MLDKALLYGWILDGQGGGQQLTAAAVPEALASATGPVWLHLERSVAGLDDWLQTVAGLPRAAIGALLAEDTRPRCDSWPAGLLLNLRGVNMNPGAAPEDTLSVRIWATDRLIITLRLKPIIAVRSLHQRLTEANGPHDIAEFMARLAVGLTDLMAPVLDGMEEELDRMEEVAEADHTQIRIDALTDLRSKASLLRRFLAPQQAAVARLTTSTEVWLTDSARLSLRQTSDDVTRYVEDLDALRERAAILKDAITQKQAERANRTMYVLTIVAGVFLPLGFLTGLLGINVGGMPGVDSANAFWIVCALLVVIVIGEWLFLKRRGWL